MIIWTNPAALWGLAAVFAAVLVHLLFRARAVRAPFPTLRFVVPAFASASRVRRPSDLALLAIRSGVLAAAALAFARPSVVTPSRLAAWDSRVARAVVVDASGSMAPARAAAGEAASAEARASFRSITLPAPDLAAGLRDAAVWLAASPPARREVVVVTDAQAGALSAADLAPLPAAVGVRFITVGSPPDVTQFEGPPLLDGERTTTPRVRLNAETTTAVFRPGGSRAEGMELIAPASQSGAVGGLRDVLSRAGTPAPRAARPVVVTFAGAAPPVSVERISMPWMVEAARRIAANRELRSTGVPAAQFGDGDPWLTVLRDDAGRPLVRVGAAGDRLALDVAAQPRDFVAAAAVRASLLATADHGDHGEQEVRTIPREVLASWARAASPIDRNPAAWRGRTPSDARWLWGLALVLIAVEAVMRRRAPDRPARETAHAA